MFYSFSKRRKAKEQQRFDDFMVDVKNSIKTDKFIVIYTNDDKAYLKTYGIEAFNKFTETIQEQTQFVRFDIDYYIWNSDVKWFYSDVIDKSIRQKFLLIRESFGIIERKDNIKKIKVETLDYQVDE